MAERYSDGLDEVRKLSSISVSRLDLTKVEIDELRPVPESVPIYEIIHQWPALPPNREATITLTFKVGLNERQPLRSLPVAILNMFHAAEQKHS